MLPPRCLCFSSSFTPKFSPHQLRPQTCSPSASPILVAPVALAAQKNKKAKNYRPTISNRAATFKYEILETHECGIELHGTEVKSVRDGQMNIKEAYGRVKDGELFLQNAHISGWAGAHRVFDHDPIRTRRLLLHKRMIRKLEAKQKDPGLTLIPTRAYFSDNNYLKVEIALARGKKLHDKREDLKKRDNEREIRRAMKAVL